MGLFSSFSKAKKEDLDKGLAKTKESVLKKLTRVVVGRSKVDDDVLDDLEEVLISSDVGVNTTLKIIDRIQARVSKDKFLTTNELNSILREEIEGLLIDDKIDRPNNLDVPDGVKPYVIMVVGVNGVGKTTTIGKLAHQFKKAGKSVVLGAADTFRAAAIDQLVVWANRVGVPIVKQQMGSDPASVAFDTLASAKTQNADVVIIDTAGRLHNKVNLMNELTKIKNVMQKVVPGAPHEVLLVLDATAGQNAISQARGFSDAAGCTGIVLAKIDGSAKGGVIVPIRQQFDLPVKLVGLGEQLEDLAEFDAELFARALFDDYQS